MAAPLVPRTARGPELERLGHDVRLDRPLFAQMRIPRHLDSDSSENWTAIPRQTGQFNRVASGV